MLKVIKILIINTLTDNGITIYRDGEIITRQATAADMYYHIKELSTSEHMLYLTNSYKVRFNLCQLYPDLKEAFQCYTSQGRFNELYYDKTIAAKYDEKLIYSYIQGDNIICNSIAGSGKTTMLIDLHTFTPRNTIILTYNKRLQLEITNRIEQSYRLGMSITAYTFHSYAGRQYGMLINNDELFDEAISSGPPIFKDDIKSLFIDEAQDLTPLYLQFLQHITGRYKNIQIILTGDKYQQINPNSLNDFTEDSKVLADINSWKFFNIKNSYRLTREMAAYVNNHIFNDNIIESSKKGSKPLHLVGENIGEITDLLIKTVNAAVKKYPPGEIYILFPSVNINMEAPKFKSNILTEFMRHMQHKLSIPILIQNTTERQAQPNMLINDDGECSGDDLSEYDDGRDDKIVIMTFHSSKGCERKCVIVVGIDETYFKFYNPNHTDIYSVPNVIGVALTRASEALIIISSDNTIRTTDINTVDNDVDIRGTLKPTTYLYGLEKNITSQQVFETDIPYKTQLYDYLFMQLINFDDIENFPETELVELVKDSYVINNKGLQNSLLLNYNWNALVDVDYIKRTHKKIINVIEQIKTIKNEDIKDNVYIQLYNTKLNKIGCGKLHTRINKKNFYVLTSKFLYNIIYNA